MKILNRLLKCSFDVIAFLPFSSKVIFTLLFFSLSYHVKNMYVSITIHIGGSTETDDPEHHAPRYRPDGIDALCKATGNSR